MFAKWQQMGDDLNDEITPLLNSLNERTFWNQRCKNELANLTKILVEKKYITFVGHPHRYHLSSIGDSCLYDVPLDRRGALAPFRGKRIRLVCVSSGRFERLLMAGSIDDTPKHLLLRQAKPQYVFPNLDNQEIVYSSPRYRALKTNAAYPIELPEKAAFTTENAQVGYVLFDGTLGLPIAVLRVDKHGAVIGKLIGRYTSESVYETLQIGLRSLANEAKKSQWLFT